MAFAGGFDRGGVNIDLLFHESEVAAEASATVVLPQRQLNDVTRDVNIATGVTGAAPASTATVDVDSDFVVPRFGLKFALGEHADCLGTYSQPFGADSEFGLNNAYSASAVNFEIDTDDLGLTCSLNLSVGSFQFGDYPETKGKLRFIFGGSYLKLEGEQGRQTFADFAGVPAATLAFIGLGGLDSDGVGVFKLSDEAFGYRIGIGYEIPIPDAKRGFRISAVYASKYDLDLTGTVDISAFNTPVARAVPTSKVSATSEIPQSIEVKAQAPIPGLDVLADARFKWQDWSKLGSIPINGVISPATGQPSAVAFEPLYQDGLTFELGVAAELAEGLSGRIAGRWDKGTSTTFGFQTDTWSGSLGVQFSNEFVDVSLGGSVGVLTSGSSSGVDTIDPANDLNYTFGSDLVGAFQGAVRFRF